MKDRKVNVDNGWVNSFTYRELYKHGYSVGGYIDKGVPKYVLYRADKEFTRIHEFDTAEELNNMLKLLLPPSHDD